MVAHVQKQYPGCFLCAAGWSLGANILVKYLGEEGQETPVNAAVAMCNPFNLVSVAMCGLLVNYDFLISRNRILEVHPSRLLF